MRYCLSCLNLLLRPLTAFAQNASWQQIRNDARGRAVWLNVWGDDNVVSQYLDWVSGEMETHYSINLKIVRLADAADAVKCTQAGAASGRRTGGSVDLLWINGEDFRTLEGAGLLQTQWTQTLPNRHYVDTQKLVTEDFSVPTEGVGSPWGGAQLTSIAWRDLTAQPPQSPQTLFKFAQAHPGTMTCSRPLNFIGTVFLEQLLIPFTTRPQASRAAPDATAFAEVTVSSWQYLDTLHPVLWREDKDFPPTPARMNILLNNGTLRLSLTFNLAHAQQKVANGELPKSNYSFGFSQGMLGNVHFVAIPANARVSAGAKIVADFLFSPEVQLRKADPAIWGDPSVLDPQKLPDEQRGALLARIPQGLPVVLPELHAAWVNALEQEWLRRYDTH